MINARLAYIKNYYIDAVDPDSAIFRVALRTAVACIICILLLQFSGELALSAWGGFAAFAFVQNDLPNSFFNRFWFLIAVILIFTGLTFSGMLLGNQPWLFWLTVPGVTFGCAYIACLGFSYFNAGSWALFLYVLAGANPVSLMRAEKIGLVFLLCGIVSVLVCFLIFPMPSYHRIMRHYQRILTKILQLFEYNANGHEKNFNKLSAQLDKLLELQERNMGFYLRSRQPIEPESLPLLSLEKWLYQIGLMAKSILAWGKRIDTPVDDCQHLIIFTLKDVISQIKRKRSPDFAVIYTRLDICRKKIAILRRQEINLDDAAYFYHYQKMLELLEKASHNLAQLTRKA